MQTENSDNLVQISKDLKYTQAQSNSIKIDESTTTKMVPEYQQHITVK